MCCSLSDSCAAKTLFTFTGAASLGLGLFLATACLPKFSIPKISPAATGLASRVKIAPDHLAIMFASFGAGMLLPTITAYEGCQKKPLSS